MRRLIPLLALLSILVAPNLYAIGGDRRGFTLTVGAGYSPFAIYHSRYGSTSDIHTGMATTFGVGYGFSDRDAFVIEGTTTFWSIGRFEFLINSSSINWYHYFDSDPGSFYTVVGVGAISLDAGHDTPPAGFLWGWGDPAGPGLILGAGYEVFQRGLLGARLGAGYGNPLTMTHVSVLFTYMAY